MKKTLQKPEQKVQNRKPETLYRFSPSHHPYSSHQHLRTYHQVDNINKPDNYNSPITPKQHNHQKLMKGVKNNLQTQNNTREQYYKNQNQGKRDMLVQKQGQPKEFMKKDKQSPRDNKISIKKQIKETLKHDLSDYQKLHNKLNYLETKISQMNVNIDKRRKERKTFLENEKNQRLKRIEAKAKKEPLSQPTNNLKKFITQVNTNVDFRLAQINPYSPRHNIYYVSEILKYYKEDKSLARDHIISSTQFIKIFDNKKIPTSEEMAHKKVTLEKRNSHKDKKTIIFDLDQTLIHCNESLNEPHDIKIKIKFPTGDIIEAGINVRPHAIEILQNLSKNFEVIVFTASHSCYANQVLDYLDPNSEYIHHRLYREHCHLTPEGVYVKDLRIINRPLSQMVLVDNAAYSYVYQLDNAIPIIPYYKGKIDFQLKALQHYIEQNMIFKEDLREVCKKTFQLHRYKQFEDVEKLVGQLYGSWA